MDGFLRRRQHLGCLVGVELAGAFAADGEVAVALFPEPGEIGFGGDAGIHDDERALEGVETLERVLQRARLGGVSGEHLRAAGEAAAVEPHAEGNQRTVGALLLRASARGLGIFVGGAFKVGIGQVVERDGGWQSKQVPDAGEQRSLDGGAVTRQEVGDAVEANRRHRLEVGVERFAERTAAAHPRQVLDSEPGSACGRSGWRPRPRWSPLKPRFCTNGGEADPADGGKPNDLDADRAGAGALQGRYVDLGEVGPGEMVWRRWDHVRKWLSSGDRLAGHVTVGRSGGGIALGRRSGASYQASRPGCAANNASMRCRQTRPVRPRQVEMTAEVDQGLLADLIAGTEGGGDEAVGEIGLAGRFVPGVWRNG